MKAAVSLPDDLFREAEAAAKRLRASRSRLYATALADFLDRQQAGSITNRLNEILAEAGESGQDTAQSPTPFGRRGRLVTGVQRGDIWWADLPQPRRSEPGFRRPVVKNRLRGGAR